MTFMAAPWRATNVEPLNVRVAGVEGPFQLYGPFSLSVVWSFARNVSPDWNAYPSKDAPGAARLMFPVLAALTASFQDNPISAASSCCLVVASVGFVPSARPVTLFPCKIGRA